MGPKKAAAKAKAKTSKVTKKISNINRIIKKLAFWNKNINIIIKDTHYFDEIFFFFF